jgi:hypothetical protein
MRHVAVLGEFGFEALDLRSEREGARPEDSSERFVQFVVDSSVLALERDEAHDAPASLRDCFSCLHVTSLPFGFANTSYGTFRAPHE